MTPEQLGALKVYIDERCRFLIERRLNGFALPDYQLEGRFNAAMLARPKGDDQ